MKEDNYQHKDKTYYAKNVPIQLDNVCDTTGDLRPRWFRFEDEEHQIHLVKIIQIVSHKEINYVGMKMLQFICRTCEGNDNEESCIEHLVELRYSILMHKWVFFQLLS